MNKQKDTMLLFVMYGCAFLAGFNENLMNMGLMDIMSEYGVDSVTAQWLVTGYMIVSTLMVTSMAYLYRRFPLRALFFTAAGLSIVGSGIGLVSVNFPMLMAARLVQALGLGLFIPMMMNTVLATVPKNKLGSYMAIGGCMISFGPAFAPVVCGALVTALGWHSTFAVPFIGIIVLSVLGATFVRNFENSEAHLDLPSLTLSAVFLFTLSFGLAQLSVSALQGGISLVVAVLSGACFVVRQRKTPHPLIDMTPMRNKAFWPAVVLTFIAMLTTFSLSVLLPLYFEGSLLMTALMAGIIILVPVLLNCFATLLGGRIMDKRGEWPLLPGGFLLMTLGVLVMALVAPAKNVPVMFAAALVAYAGVGLVFSPSQTAGLKTLPPSQNPFGVALMTTFTQIAACVGPSLFVGVMSGVQNGALASGFDTEMAVAQGFSIAIYVAAAIAALGTVAAFAYTRKITAEAATITSHVRSEAKGPLATTNLDTVINHDPYLFPEDMPVFAAMSEMVTRGISGAPLVNAAGKLAGYLSDGDIMRYLAEQHPTFASSSYSFVRAANSGTIDERMKELMDLPCKVICTNTAITLPKDSSFEDACNLLSTRKMENVPVVDKNNHVVGSINRSTLLRATMGIYLEQKNLFAKA